MIDNSPNDEPISGYTLVIFGLRSLIFISSVCQAKSPVKTLDRLDVNRLGEEIEVCAEARSFLHNQVRILVGTLKMVGVGKWRARDVANALAARDRAKAGPTAPSDGLYLVSVEYE